MTACKLILALVAGCLAVRSQDLPTTFPLRFEPNHGQVPSGVKFVARGANYTVFIKSSEITFRAGTAVLRMSFRGANANAEAVGLAPLGPPAHYLIGEREMWHTDVPMYGQVKCQGVYPGVDVVYYSSPSQRLEYDLVVGPRAETSQIRVRFEGAERIWTDTNGDLVLRTSSGEWRHSNARIYQTRNRVRQRVTGRFVALGPDEAGLELYDYDRSLPLIIDPTLTFSTYLGGSGQDGANSVAADSAGNTYVAGWTESLDFPEMAGPKMGSPGGVDAFVAKMSPAGKLLYVTYLGGSLEDRANGIAVDATGAAVVAGFTYSGNFPTWNAAQSHLGGAKDGFLLKLSPAGNALLFSTYLGGSGSDGANAVALDPQGNIYVAGETTSANFPVINGIQSQIGGGLDAFVTKFSSSGTRLYGTYLGGTADDKATAIAVDAGGDAYITGATWSLNFPLVSPFQPRPGGGQDVFAAKIGPAGNTLVYSTYLGGSGSNMEIGNGVAIDASGCAYIVGTTSSVNFPVLNPLQSSLKGSQNAFVLKLNASGGALVYSTYLGGSSVDIATAVAVDGSGKAYVAGWTGSTDFPVATAVQSANAGGYDAFVATLTATGSSLQMASYLGGKGLDTASAISLDSGGNIYVAGQTQSGDWPTSGAIQVYKPSATSAFLTRLSAAPIFVAASLTPTARTGANATFAETATDQEGYTAIDTTYLLFNSAFSVVNGCLAAYSRSANVLWLVSDDANTWIGPAAMGSSTILQNSQCSLSAAQSSVSVSGNSLSVNFAIAFKAAFTGLKQAYIHGITTGGRDSGWQPAGSCTVSAAQPPTVASLAPAAGSGMSATFSLTVADQSDHTNIDSVYLLFNTSFNVFNSCLVAYSQTTNSFWLVSDDANTWMGPIAPVSAKTLQNSQCVLNAAQSSVSTGGNAIIVNFAVTFQAAFAGTKQIYTHAINLQTQDSGWQLTGTWTAASQPPTFISLTPATATGPAATLTLTMADQNGHTDINTVYLVLNTSFNLVNACLVAYSQSNNALWLVSDDANTWMGPLTPGSAQTLQNSQCVLNAAQSSVSATGPSLAVAFALTLKTSFSGPKQIYVHALNATGLDSGWALAGAWQN